MFLYLSMYVGRSRLVGTETTLLPLLMNESRHFFTRRLLFDTRISNLHLVFSPVVLNSFRGGTKVSTMTDAVGHGLWNVVGWCPRYVHGETPALYKQFFIVNYASFLPLVTLSLFVSPGLVQTARLEHDSTFKSTRVVINYSCAWFVSTKTVN